MSDEYARLAQSTEPITPEDAQLLRNSAVAGKVFAAIGALVTTGLALGGVSMIRFSTDAFGKVFGGVFLLVSLGFLGLLFYVMTRTSADAGATQKIVYVGTVTNKRVQSSDLRDAQGHPTGSSTQIVSLDGVDFASALVFSQVEVGQRVALHCVRPGEPFRVTWG